MQELLQAGEAISKGEGEEDEKELTTDGKDVRSGCKINTSNVVSTRFTGMLELKAGDYLWTRNEFGNRDPMDDVPVAWVVGP